MTDTLAVVLRERGDLLDREDLRSLLLAVPIFLERLDAEPRVRELMGDTERETAALMQRFREHDGATIVKLKGIRKEIPRLDIDETEAPGLAGQTLSKFDALSAREADLPEIPSPGDGKDHSISGALLDCLEMRLHQTDEPLQGELRAKLTQVRWEHEHAVRAFTNRAVPDPGFALRRLRVIGKQLNPRPGHALARELFDELHLNVYCYPDSLRKFASGARTGGSTEAAGMEASVREDVCTVCRELARRLGSVRSREGLLQTYKLRCEWYDVEGIARLIEELQDERQKEDRLVEHLALFLFDNGLRPLTWAMVGRLIPDVFEPAPAGQSFYVEAKQYGDAAGARKAIADGPRQIWSTDSPSSPGALRPPGSLPGRVPARRPAPAIRRPRQCRRNGAAPDPHRPRAIVIERFAPRGDHRCNRCGPLGFVYLIPLAVWPCWGAAYCGKPQSLYRPSVTLQLGQPE